MKTFGQWNCGDDQRGILTIIKNDIISYEKAACSSFDYAFSHHAQDRLLCNDMLTKTIDLFQEMATVVEDFYHRVFLKCFGSQSPNKEARATCWNVVTTLLVCLVDELHAVRVVTEDTFNCSDRENKLYLCGVLQAHQVME